MENTRKGNLKVLNIRLCISFEFPLSFWNIIILGLLYGLFFLKTFDESKRSKTLFI